MSELTRRPLWLAIGWCLVALVAAASLMPPSGMPDVAYNDKLAHAASYFVLMGWFGQIVGPRTGLMAALLGMGALIEVLQGASGYRDMSLADWVANAAGIALGWLFVRHFPNLLRHLDALLS